METEMTNPLSAGRVVEVYDNAIAPLMREIERLQAELAQSKQDYASHISRVGNLMSDVMYVVVDPRINFDDMVS